MVIKLKINNFKVITGQTSTETILKILLDNRQIKDFPLFLKPPYPELKLSSKKAVSIINKHLKSSKNILIYGDYDVDGLTSTAILWQSLYSISSKVTPFIPHRQNDGYGFKADSLFRFQKNKKIVFDLVITVDNGIVAEKEFAKAKKKNKDLKIVVVDHHLAGEKLNSVDAIYHSTQTSASALSWFLAKNFTKSPSLSLAALGVVADCQPLTGLNRSLVFHGLGELKVNPPPGLKKLLEIAGAKQDSVGVYELGYIIGPRLNATGRLADATDSLRLLCSQNSLQASKYARILEDHNQNRQELQKESIDVAEESLGRDAINHVSGQNNKIIFITGSFNPGIIGLIASRLTQKYALPSVIISTQDNIARGSCRSIPEVDIITTLRKFNDLFVDLGGHPGAAGFSILTQNIPKLKKQLIKHFSLSLANYLPSNTIFVDARMDISAVNLKNIKLINSLSPFGIGNQEPQFLFENVKIDNLSTLGKNQEHLKFKVGHIDILAFKKASDFSYLKNGDAISFVARLNSNTWNGNTFPQLIIQEIMK